MVKRRLIVDWKAINGAARKKRILHLKENDEGIFICPVRDCLHIGFKSIRGVRKHVNVHHTWYFYFEVKPAVTREEAAVSSTASVKPSTSKKPSFSIQSGAGYDFFQWLQTPCAGGKKKKQAEQIATRAMKFLMASLGDTATDQYANDEYIDCCLGSPAIVISFLRTVMEDWRLSSGGALPYLKAIGDLLDFRKASGVTDDVLRSFTCTDVYIRRGKENLSRQKQLDYGRNLDLESLISRNSWASVEEMERVIPYHTPKYQYVLKKSRNNDSPPSVSELAFATRFLATFLFLRVKCTRPMTYQYLTVQMIKDARKSDGFIDSTKFKTQQTYVFDTLVLTKDVLDIMDIYIDCIRPLTNPSCDYVLTNTKGTQFTPIGTAMSLLVHQAIGKFVNPTRYRQIIESESSNILDTEEQEAISHDQKHSSEVAKRMYKKRLSRDVAVKGAACMRKIVGTGGEKHTEGLAASIRALNGEEEENGEGNNIGVTTCDADQIPCSSSSPQVDETSPQVDETPGETAGSEDGRMDGSNSVGPDASNSPIKIDDPDDSETIPSASLNTEETNTEKEPAATSRIPTALAACAGTSTGANDHRSYGVEIKKEDLTTPSRKMQFTSEEDTFIKKGVVKYGVGKWAQILRHDSYKFHPARTRDAIRMRADTLGITNKRRNKRKAV